MSTAGSSPEVIKYTAILCRAYQAHELAFSINKGSISQASPESKAWGDPHETIPPGHSNPRRPRDLRPWCRVCPGFRVGQLPPRGTMPKARASILKAVQGAYRQDVEVVEAAPLTSTTKWTCQIHVSQFVRWLAHQWNPGPVHHHEEGAVRWLQNLGGEHDHK